MNDSKAEVHLDGSTRYKKNVDGTRGCRPKLETLIHIDGESVSVSLLVQNPGLNRAREYGRGRWCLRNPCRNHSTCQYLHRKECQPERSRETGTSAVQMALELANLEDPLKYILADESKRKGFQNLLRVTDAVQYLLPIVHRIMTSFENSEAPFSEDLVEVRMWCDAWVTRSTEHMDKLIALPPDTQNSFFSLVYGVCRRDPTSPDTRRALGEASNLTSVSPEERQTAVEFLRDTESNIKMAELDEESDQKQKRYVVSKMYHEAATPVFNNAVWPSSARELRSSFSELRALPGLVVDRFIPSEPRGLHLRALQHLSRADFMHSLNEIATGVLERGLDVLKKNHQQLGYQHRFQVYQLTFKHVNSTPYDGLLAVFVVKTRFISQKAQFLSGDLVLLWQEGIPMKDENCFVAVVKKCEDGTVSLSPVDLLRCWPFLKPQARFLLVRSQNFYLPTAASLKQLRVQESKVAENNEPDLLRALIIGDEAMDPPIYLQHNPAIEIGCCVALRDGSESKQPALNDCPGSDWSEEAEKKVRQSSDGEMALLDPTQVEALQHIMRNRVAVVQGTPGTGKSFVGSKFLQLLLFNNETLGIGPIVVMTFTHHALESVFESLIPVTEGYGVKIGLLGNPKNENMKPYVIPMRHPRSENADALVRVAKEIDAIKSCSTLGMKTEDEILGVMAKHMDPHTHSVWIQKCRMHRENWQSVQSKYNMLRQEVSEELCIPIPVSLNALEQMSLALKTNQWHGEVDIMPFLMNQCLDIEDAYFDDISDVLKDISDLKREVHLNKAWIDDAVKYVEECFSLLNDDQNNNILTYCIETFVRGIDNLIALIKPMPAVYMPFLESWRMEGMPDGHTLPPLADMTTAASAHVEDTNQMDAVDAQLQELEREEGERRRQERDLDNDVEELGEKHQMTFLSLPTKEERDALARDACNRISTAPPGAERSELISVLLQERMYSLQEGLNTLVAKINEEKEDLKKKEANMNAREFERYAVIGATSTKLMHSVGAIQRCGASVLVVEEAAEVLESHLLACITASMQHVVLIGDHKQLKPKVNEYLLEREKNLAVSTMERLVLCGLPCVTLTMQRRMAPEISDLTKPYYRRSNVAGDTAVIIEDHPRTLNISPPFGVCHEDGTPIRLFFLSHDGQGEKAESMRNSLMSPENRFEAKIVACIAHYLMKVNMGKSITILTPYTGQHLAVLKELESLHVPRRSKYIGTDIKKELDKGVRLSTVDDFQGEEDDIIILSLVRTEKHGFLRLDNRACVALSRARSALYVVGCGALLSGASALWANLERHCCERKSIGTRFPARCNHHPARDLTFGSTEEYELHRAHCPTPCGAELDCGHICESLCHGEREHPPCQSKCNRVGQLCIPPRPCRHICAERCGYKCGDCMVRVDYKYPDCGHCVNLYCYQLENLPPCTMKCTQEAECGHEVEAECVEHAKHTSFRKCKEKCGVHMSCGHVCSRNCHHGEDEEHEKQVSKCTRPQRSKAPCGHEVEHSCNRKDIASLCKARCGKVVASCRKAGNKSVCQLMCGHKGSCDCKEKATVELPCGHMSDAFACASTDPPPICSVPCNATLECGHQCGGECGLCAQRKFHSDCREPGKALVCGHNSNLGCTATVNICEELCAFYCGHGKPCNELGKNALHRCSECPSRVCKELCQWQCPHGKCRKKCSEPCEFEVTEDNSVALSSGCWRRCEQNFSCGHRCCGLCGERCPPFCRECYEAGDAKALALAERVVTYIDDEELEILRKDNSVEAQSLVELPCCQMIFGAQELYDFFASKAEEKEISALTCPQCRAMVLPNAFHHAGVFIKKRLLQASNIMKQVHAAAKEQAEHGVGEILTYIQEELKFPNTGELKKAIELARKGMKVRNKKNTKKENLTALWRSFETSCTKLEIETKWILLLRYHIEVLENALGNLRKNDSCIAKNANLLAEAALRFTIMDRTFPGSVLGGSSLISFCAGMLNELVKPQGNLAKSFPTAQVDEEVQCFCQRIEWTYLLYRMEPHIELSGHSFEAIVEMGKHFATKGVKPDEVDQERKVKQRINDVLKENLKQAEAQYAAKALGLSAGHWFECPNGHLYAIGDCGGAMETGVCPECGSAIGGTSHTLLRDNAFAGRLIEGEATPSWPTVLMDL